MPLIAVEQHLLLVEIDETHAATLETERCKFRIRDFKKNIDDCVA